MLYPENFLEWEWRTASGGPSESFGGAAQSDARIWRVTAVVGPVGGTITYSIGPPQPTNNIITLPASTMYGADPYGMLVLAPNGTGITFDVGITSWVVEWIRKVQ